MGKGKIMNPTVNDAVFGVMRYDAGWEKHDTLTVFGKTFPVCVTAAAYTGQDIMDIQRQAYGKYLTGLPSYVAAVPAILLRYYLDNYDDISSYMEIPEKINRQNITAAAVVKLIKIRTVYFDRKGNYGWLCDCAWDTEHGIAIVLSASEPFITDQDYLI